MSLTNLYLIVGPSGSGKTTLSRELEQRCKMTPVVSYTTRPMRKNETNGTEHWFISDEEFDELPELAAYTEFNGQRYGVTFDMLERADIYVIDPAGVEFLRNNQEKIKKNIVVIGIIADDVTCREHMKKRGDNDDIIAARLKHDKKAFHNYQYICDFMFNTKLLPADELANQIAMTIFFYDKFTKS